MNFFKKKGQSLIEVTIGIGIGAILIGGAVGLINGTIRVSSENEFLQSAWFINQAATEAVGFIAESEWRTVYAQTENPPGFYSANLPEVQQCRGCLEDPGSCPECSLPNPPSYCPQAGSCPFTIESCEPPFTPTQLNNLYKLVVNNIDYYVCFDADKVDRDQNGNISTLSLAENDSSTLKFSIKTLWGENAQFETPPLVKYFTRHNSEVFHQTDWSAGEGQDGAWIIENRFDTQSNIDITTPGEISITP